MPQVAESLIFMSESEPKILVFSFCMVQSQLLEGLRSKPVHEGSLPFILPS